MRLEKGAKEGNFRVLDTGIHKAVEYVFIEHMITRDTNWVRKSAIHEEGVADAFWGADPLFFPGQKDD